MNGISWKTHELDLGTETWHISDSYIIYPSTKHPGKWLLVESRPGGIIELQDSVAEAKRFAESRECFVRSSKPEEYGS